MQKKTSADFRVVFANAFRLRVGDNDCGLTFIVETDDTEGAVQLDQIQVSLTPRTLKILNYGVTKALERLEATVGPINVPADKLRSLDEAFGAPPKKAKAGA